MLTGLSGLSGLSSLCGSPSAPTQRTQTRIAGIGSNGGNGINAWLLPNNVGGDDGQVASVSGVDGETSQFLHATQFGFSIPDGATIDGVEVRVSIGSESTNTVSAVNTVVPVVGGLRQEDDHSADAALLITPGGLQVKTYGGPAAAWGQSLTPDDVNDVGFGAAIRVELDDNSVEEDTVSVDYVEITVYYTTAPPVVLIDDSGVALTDDSGVVLTDGE